MDIYGKMYKETRDKVYIQIKQQIFDPIDARIIKKVSGKVIDKLFGTYHNVSGILFSLFNIFQQDENKS